MRKIPKQLTFDTINDLLGVRIIVESQQDCYEAQSILHAFWHPVTDAYNGKAGPNPDWLARSKDKEGNSNYLFARTRQARNKIHSWLNKHKEQLKKGLS